MSSDGQVQYTRKEIARKKRQRLEKTSLMILQGMVGYELWSNTHDEELVDQSIKLAKVFIEKMDAEMWK